MQTRILQYKRIFLLGFFAIAVFSCRSVQLISTYDEVTDKAVTNLQEKVSRFFVEVGEHLGTEKAQYQDYQSFYREAKVHLATLQIRANAIDKNDIVQQQLKELSQLLGELEQMHKIGFPNKESLALSELACNRAFTAIIKLQLALKRGEK
jgi:hypothetical protein